MQKKTYTKHKSPAKLTAAIIISLCLGYLIGQGSTALRSALFSAPISIAENAIQVRFSPGGQCLQFTQQAIALAQKIILVQAYAFTAPAIAEALIAAHKRGVNVKILVDRSQLTAKASQVNRVLQQGIPVSIDVVPGIAHNKVMIIDDQYVLTGSFNWSNAAETKNAENLLLIADKQVNKIYAANWQARAAYATPLHPANY
jgi:phospholipase D